MGTNVWISSQFSHSESKFRLATSKFHPAYDRLFHSRTPGKVFHLCSVWSNEFMTDLDQVRREKWHLDGRAVRTFDDARSFLESVGFCMMYSMRNQALG